MRTPAFVIGLAAIGAAATVNAAALLQWDFGTSNGTAATFAATYADPALQSSTLSRGAGFPGSASGFQPTRGSFATDSGSNVATLAAANTANHYFQFAAAPQPGATFSLSSLDFYAWQQNIHPSATIEVLYSLDGFATAGTSVGSVTNINDSWSGTAHNVALDGVSALQNISQPVTFRLYYYGFGAWEQRGLGQVIGSNVDLGLSGVVPEPTALGVLGAGATLLLGRRRK